MLYKRLTTQARGDLIKLVSKSSSFVDSIVMCEFSEYGLTIHHCYLIPVIHNDVR